MSVLELAVCFSWHAFLLSDLLEYRLTKPVQGDDGDESHAESTHTAAARLAQATQWLRTDLWSE
jgi:hypothetical protein